jgi:hypothetical protein
MILRNYNNIILSSLINKKQEVRKKNLCMGICDFVKAKFKGARKGIKGIGSFSCNHCGIHFPIYLLDKMYDIDEDIINLVIKYKSVEKLEQLRRNQRFCFCCGHHLSVRKMGSFVSSKREQLEFVGLVKRY